MRSVAIVILLAAAGLGHAPVAAQQGDWSGYFSIEPRYFPDEPLFEGQPPAGISPSAVLSPEYRFERNEGKDRITVIPYLRYDADDGNRSHLDLREANWQHFSDSGMVLAGIGKVFWGVTESRHLVDIVNQTDLVEDIDEEDKLGQPMLLLERWIGEGTLTGLLLPGFRERTFPAPDARLRGTTPVATDRPVYESGAADRRVDLAVRWFQAAGKWDLGIGGFYGTSREPGFLPSVDAAGRFVLLPRYDVIVQIGVDAQYTSGAWLWKFEAIDRTGPGYSFGAGVGGFEYTVYGVGDTAADLGLLAEYLYDGRGANAPPTYYDNDLFLGLRWSLNDPQATAVLAGVVMDRESQVFFVEAERRLGAAWKLELEARLLNRLAAADPVVDGWRDDSFITLRIARYL